MLYKQVFSLVATTGYLTVRSTDKKAFSSTLTLFHLFGTEFSVNPRDACARVKIPADQAAFAGKHSEHLVWNRQPCSPHSNSLKSPSLPFSLPVIPTITLKSGAPHLCRHLPCHGPFRWQAIKRFCQIKWPTMGRRVPSPKCQPLWSIRLTREV